MKVTFGLTQQDYIDFTIFHAKNLKPLKNQVEFYRIITSLIPVIAGLIAIKAGGKSDMNFLFFMILISIAIFIYLPRYFYYHMIKSPSFDENYYNILGERTLFFYDEYIYTETKYNYIEMEYNSIIDVEQSDNAIYLFDSPVSAVIIPFRAFEFDEEKQRFIDYIKSKIELHKKF